MNNKVGVLPVSVIIPTYNRVALVQRAIESLLRQTRVPDEILIINDGSSDATAETLGEYAHPVRVITQPNLGRSPARNRGLQEATGELIAFLDDDDTLMPTSIARRAEALEESSAYDAVYSDVLVVDAEGQTLGRYSELQASARPSGMIFAALARYNFMPIHAVMFRRACIASAPAFDVRLNHMEDYDFWLRMAAVHPFLYVDDALALYHVHAGMTTQQMDRMRFHDLEVHERIFAMPSFQQLTAAEQAAIYCTHGTRYAAAGRVGSARRWYGRAIMTKPTYLRPYLLSGLTLMGSSAFNRVAKLRSKGGMAQYVG